MALLSGGSEPLMLVSALTSRQISHGHICFDPDEFSGSSEEEALKEAGIVLPPKDQLTALFENIGEVGKPGEYKPLIFDGKRFYLYRYWFYEDRLYRRTLEMAERKMEPWDGIKDSLLRLFGPSAGEEVDYQRLAAFTALTSEFSVISGGPGTGKTTTVSKILALLFEKDASLRVALAAPTGKAAARMNDSIASARNRMKEEVSDEVLELLASVEGKTIHRLLGYRKNSPYFRHNNENPLEADIVIVDEASMIDLALFSKLVDALPSNARLILLGDKDQLASVEAGSVLGDICSGSVNRFSEDFVKKYLDCTGEKVTVSSLPGTLADAVVELKKSYRFGKKPGIGALAGAVNRGESIEIIDEVFGKFDRSSGINFCPLPPATRFKSSFGQRIRDGFKSYIEAETPGEALEKLNCFRLLAAVREHDYGVRFLNRITEELLESEKLIERDGEWYENRPVMILENDYNLGLFNGDVGIVRSDENGNRRVYFPVPEGIEPKPFIPTLLPRHETVYAMTVHKSQGSEFENVLFFLPPREIPVLTRELLYTGITRAKEFVELIAVKDVMDKAVRSRVERSSGLRDRLGG